MPCELTNFHLQRSCKLRERNHKAVSYLNMNASKIDSRQTSAGNWQLATAGRQLTVGNRHQATKGRQLAVGNSQHAE